MKNNKVLGAHQASHNFCSFYFHPYLLARCLPCVTSLLQALVFSSTKWGQIVPTSQNCEHSVRRCLIHNNCQTQVSILILLFLLLLLLVLLSSTGVTLNKFLSLSELQLPSHFVVKMKWLHKWSVLISSVSWLCHCGQFPSPVCTSVSLPVPWIFHSLPYLK